MIEQARLVFLFFIASTTKPFDALHFIHLKHDHSAGAK